MTNRSKGVCFAVGTGRCGTQFLYKVLSKEPAVASHHERHPLSDTFERYCRWNALPVDPAGFLAIKQSGVQHDLAQHQISFEASAYLSLSIKSLFEHFDAKFIFLVRSPHKVVNSYLQKDWYDQHLHRSNTNLASGIQPGMEEKHHSFSRLTPVGVEAEDWQSMSRVGKLAWFWKSVNQQILNQLQEVPTENYRVIRIEDFDYQKYCEVADFMGYNAKVSADAFARLTESRPNRLFPKRQVSNWTQQERAEFEEQVSSLSKIWGYCSRTADIQLSESQNASTSTINFLNKYHNLRKKMKVKKRLIRYLESL